jgi:hypothetical protein
VVVVHTKKGGGDLDEILLDLTSYTQVDSVDFTVATPCRSMTWLFAYSSF